MTQGVLRLRFSCSSCGQCCRDLRVPLTLADARRLPNIATSWVSGSKVDMVGEPETFVDLPEGRRLLVLAQDSGACVFLRDDKCSVYAARPRVCRLYPFDVTLGRRGGVRRLKLLQPNLCSGDTSGWTQPRYLAQQHAFHDAELKAHVASVQNFNRNQAHRRRLGKRLLTAEEFMRL